jgi:hypothetical protein
MGNFYKDELRICDRILLTNNKVYIGSFRKTTLWSEKPMSNFE